MFEKGNPGKQPGQVGHQKRTMMWFIEHGFDWREVAMQRVLDTKLPNASRDYALGLITERCAPKLKAIDITATGQNLQQVLIQVMGGNVSLPATEPEPIAHDETLAISVEAEELDEDQVII